MICCVVLYCVVFCFVVVSCIVLCSFALRYDVTPCVALYCVVMCRCVLLHCAMRVCNVLSLCDSCRVLHRYIW